MSEIKQWKEIHALTIKVALLCIFLGLGSTYFFKSPWIRFWGTLLAWLGFGFFYMAHKLKMKYLQPTSNQSN
jgi:Na+/phosphate symporter